ncbi:MAG: hypothetical protein J6C17_03615 [Clostridia bacterium]|nr:hypothetical protein [Clostridia bacterium]
MLMKFINEKNITNVPQNGYIVVNGKRTGFSNLLSYLNKNPEIARENGYYPYKNIPYPELKGDEYIEERFSLVNNEIVPVYTVRKYESGAEE